MKQDLRVIKSRRSIEKAFIELVEQKGFQNISITEIAEKAMVNRNTIYLNYGAKEDILESIIKDSVTRHFGDITAEDLRHIGLSRKKIENLYKNLFKVINENIALYRIILKDTSSIGYVQSEISKIQKMFKSITKDKALNKIRLSFMTSGIWGVVNEYIVNSNGTDIENINMLTDFTLSNLRHISYSK